MKSGPWLTSLVNLPTYALVVVTAALGETRALASSRRRLWQSKATLVNLPTLSLVVVTAASGETRALASSRRRLWQSKATLVNLPTR